MLLFWLRFVTINYKYKLSGFKLFNGLEFIIKKITVPGPLINTHGCEILHGIVRNTTGLYSFIF